MKDTEYIESAIQRCLDFMLQRPHKKAGTRRVIDALDVQEPAWAQAAKNPAFVRWLVETNPKTAKHRAHMLLGTMENRDEAGVVAVFKLFRRQLSGLRDFGYGVPSGENSGHRIGDILYGKYEVVERLGVGGCGEVLLVYAHPEHFAGFYALKLLHTVAPPNNLRRFEHESKLLLGLEGHPHVVAARFIEKEGDQIGLVMDYVAPNGEELVTLQHHIALGTIPFATQLKWAVHCCAGLAHAYGHGVTAHRDIKPANVLIDGAGNARISDFGLAALGIVPNIRADHSNCDGMRIGPMLTQDGATFGTPPYMAPEQFDSARACDCRSDIYSLGLTFYEMAIGHMAFPMGDRRGMGVFPWYRYVHQQGALPEFNSPLLPIIAKCCAKGPEDRFQTIEELMTALRALGSSHGLEDLVSVEDRMDSLAMYAKLANQGAAHARFGEHEMAVNYFRQAMECTSLAQVHLDLAQSLYVLRRYEEAVEVLAQDTSDPSAYKENLSGICVVKLYGWAPALPYFEAAILRDPIHFASHDNLVKAFHATAQPAKALEALNALVSLTGARAEHWVLKAETELQLGSIDEAFRSLGHAVSLDDKALESVRARRVSDELTLRSIQRRVKRLLGVEFNEGRLTSAIAAALHVLERVGPNMAAVVAAMRKEEPAITYDQAERVFRQILLARVPAS
ncbi:protein kinase [Variovorax sp. E3]|uniref:serine/threonine-protein kinase n=1 Tax=Variovorax sp. E3 TaxID=1914993 RepID=UPI0018DD64E2|nr:serine/threonine-protein kinase [Variovorax sp. E3]